MGKLLRSNSRLSVNQAYLRGRYFEDIGQTLPGAALTTEVTLTSDGTTPNIDTAWSEVVSSTSQPINQITIGSNSVNYNNTQDRSTLVEIGIGAASSEVVIVPYINFGGKPEGYSYSIPIFIPAGTRIAIRMRSARLNNAQTYYVALRTTNRFFKPSPRALIGMGTNAANSRGTDLPIGSAGVKGAWTQIISSTTQPLSALILGFDASGDTLLNTSPGYVDIAVGGAGSEQIIIPDVYVRFFNTEMVHSAANPIYACDIPRGARISARVSVSSTANSVALNIIGVPYS